MRSAAALESAGAAPDLARQSLVYLVGRGLAGLVSILAIIVLSRLLSPAAYGTYVLVLTGVGFGSIVGFRWLRLGIVRYLPASGADEADLLRSSLSAFLASAIATGAAAAGVALWLNVQAGLVIPGLILLWAQSWFDLSREILRARLRPFRYGVVSLVRSVLFFTIAAALARAGWGALAPVTGMAIAAAAPALWVLWLERDVLGRGRATAGLVWRKWRYGAPLALGVLFWWVVSSSDRLLLAAFIDTRAVGQYSIVYDLAESTLGLLMMATYLAGFPVVARTLDREGTGPATDLLRAYASSLLSVAVPATAGLILLAPDVRDVMLGPAFHQDVARVLPWIAAGAFLSGLKLYYVDLAFQLGDRTTPQVGVNAAAAAINVLLNLIWIPTYGMMGAAYATVAAYGSAVVLSAIVGRRLFALPLPLRPVVTIGASTAVMILVLLPMLPLRGPVGLALKTLTGISVYGALLWAGRSFLRPRAPTGIGAR